MRSQAFRCHRGVAGVSSMSTGVRCWPFSRQWRRQVDAGQDHRRCIAGFLRAHSIRGDRTAFWRRPRRPRRRGSRRLPGPLALHQCRRRRHFFMGRELTRRVLGIPILRETRELAETAKGARRRRHQHSVAQGQCRASLGRPAPGDRAQPFRPLGGKLVLPTSPSPRSRRADAARSRHGRTGARRRRRCHDHHSCHGARLRRRRPHRRAPHGVVAGDVLTTNTMPMRLCA